MSTELLTNRETADLCRTLSELLHAGIAAADACQLLLPEETGRTKQLLLQLGPQLDAGIPLGKALLQSSSFPAATAALIDAGEQTGYPEEALLSAAEYHEARDHTARQLRSTLGYPGIVLILMLIVVGVLLIQVLPVFDSVYASLGTSMTGIAGGLLHFGQVLKQALPAVFFLLLILTAGILCCHFHAPLRKAAVQTAGKLLDDRWIIRDFHNARFIQALSMGIRSGLVPEEAISLAAELMLESPRAELRCRECLALISRGTDFPEALSACGLISLYNCRLLSLSLRSGSTDRIITEIAAQMYTQAEIRLHDTIAKIEPAIVVAASSLVGIILLSVMLPLIQVLSALG